MQSGILMEHGVVFLDSRNCSVTRALPSHIDLGVFSCKSIVSFLLNVKGSVLICKSSIATSAARDFMYIWSWMLSSLSSMRFILLAEDFSVSGKLFSKSELERLNL